MCNPDGPTDGRSLSAPADAAALGDAIRALGHPATAITGAMGWERTSRDGQGSVRQESRIVLAMGPDLLLALDRTEDGLFVHTPGADSLEADVRAFGGDGPAEPESAATRPPASDLAAPSADPGASSSPRRFCTRCGTPVRAGLSFCTSCGARLI